MPSLEMKKQDLIELYQLLKLFRNTYECSDSYTIIQILSTLHDKYSIRTNGENIELARNPRDAGRHVKYSTQTDSAILCLREKGQSIREIAKEVNCSPGYVQKILAK